MLAWFALLIGLLGIAAVVIFRALQAQHASAAPLVESGDFPAPAVPRTESATIAIPFQTDAIREVQAECFRLAFGVVRSDYRIFGPHQEIAQQVGESLSAVSREQRHFPRRPALLPKLLRALNDKGSTREEIARLILQDAVLTGNVLQRANSSYYRQQNAAAIESVDRAIVVLGIEGLRTPVAAAVMQPVFHTPRGFFDQFAPVTWEQAHRSALAAEGYARLHRAGDPFIAHLAGLLSGLGRIVLFRLVLDRYREHGNLMPRPEVFIHVMVEHARTLSRQVAASWHMSEGFLAALDAQIQQQSPTQTAPLAKAIYFGELCGSLSLLEHHGRRSREENNALLAAQGLDDESAAELLRAVAELDAK